MTLPSRCVWGSRLPDGCLCYPDGGDESYAPRQQVDRSRPGAGLHAPTRIWIVAALGNLKEPESQLSLSFRTGWLDLILVVSGAVALGLVSYFLDMGSLHSPRCLLLATGCVAVITSVALALTKIKEANDTAVAHAAGFSQTSYRIGSVLGVAACGDADSAAGVIQFNRCRSRRGQLRTDSGTERVRG